MGSNLIIRVMEIGLFLFLLMHIIQGLMLWAQNSKARPVPYKVSRASANSVWYSRSMGLLGTLILLFLVLHLFHFWTPSRLGGIAGVHELSETQLGGEYNGQPVHDLYSEMLLVFQNNLWVVIVYVLGVISLFWHLLHGFQSAFQTFGINHKRYTPVIRMLGRAYSVIICLLFASMPVAMYLRWVE
jgi:succinate dehydrogenase / fumarate reductase cytochrome b subunit